MFSELSVGYIQIIREGEDEYTKVETDEIKWKYKNLRKVYSLTYWYGEKHKSHGKYQSKL